MDFGNRLQGIAVFPFTMTTYKSIMVQFTTHALKSGISTADSHSVKPQAIA
jgi:hypothetical protein